MVFAGIVAGGKGTRLKTANMPKQFLKIGGEPILIRTLRTFYEVDEVDCIYIATNPDWLDYTAELLKKFKFDSEKVFLIKGGADRQHSILNILDAVRGAYGCNKGDIILTHDAVRPFVSAQIIRANIDCARQKLACGTYIPSEDTVMLSNKGETIDGSLDRSLLWRAQTPQSFDLPFLWECIKKLEAEGADIGALTDTCGIISACGEKVYIVKGEPINFKITTDHDLAVARAMAR